MLCQEEKPCDLETQGLGVALQERMGHPAPLPATQDARGGVSERGTPFCVTVFGAAGRSVVRRTSLVHGFVFRKFCYYDAEICLPMRVSWSLPWWAALAWTWASRARCPGRGVGAPLVGSRVPAGLSQRGCREAVPAEGKKTTCAECPLHVGLVPPSFKEGLILLLSCLRFMKCT